MGRLMLNVLLSFAQFEREVKCREQQLGARRVARLWRGRLREHHQGYMRAGELASGPAARLLDEDGALFWNNNAGAFRAPLTATPGQTLLLE